ncbi:hypothetical protein Lser_V15G23600 [Lactuca serriola]
MINARVGLFKLLAYLEFSAFQFFLNSVLRTPAYQNDDEDMLDKLITPFLSHQLARDKKQRRRL